MREFIDAAAKIGEPRVVRGAGWDLEIGTIIELNYQRQGPALLFDEIKGLPARLSHPDECHGFAPPRAPGPGLPGRHAMEEAEREYQKVMAGYQPVPPREVSTGPICDNVLTGNDINLWKFPTPTWHEDDGGRYICTGDMALRLAGSRPGF